MTIAWSGRPSAKMLALSMLCFAAIAAAKQPTAAQWVRVRDAYRVHQRYVVKQHDGSLSMIGEFYEVEPGDVRAQCYEGAPQSFATAESAMQYVLHCEVW